MRNKPTTKWLNIISIMNSAKGKLIVLN